MKQLKNKQIIGIDNGYGNLKTASGIFPASVLTLNHEPAYAQDLLIYDGKYHVIGSGHREFTPDKVSNPDHYILTLAGIGQSSQRAGRCVSFMRSAACPTAAVNAYYGKSPTDEGLRETIRSIVREELATAPVQLGDLLQALKTAVPVDHPASPSAHDDEPDDDDLDDALDSFGC